MQVRVRSAWVFVSVVGATASVALVAGCQAGPDGDAAAAGMVSAKDRFEQLKGLAGEWRADTDKDGTPDATITYTVTANGSALAERLFPGTPHEMVTMYHLDGDDLVMTHYCAAGNQPTLEYEHSADPNTFVFEFERASNLKSPNDMMMDGLTVTLQGKDQFTAAWTSRVNGQRDDQHSPKFVWTRVK